jgi:hypothetical protein
MRHVLQKDLPFAKAGTEWEIIDQGMLNLFAIKQYGDPKNIEWPWNGKGDPRESEWFAPVDCCTDEPSPNFKQQVQQFIEQTTQEFFSARDKEIEDETELFKASLKLYSQRIERLIFKEQPTPLNLEALETIKMLETCLSHDLLERKPINAINNKAAYQTAMNLISALKKLFAPIDRCTDELDGPFDPCNHQWIPLQEVSRWKSEKHKRDYIELTNENTKMVNECMDALNKPWWRRGLIRGPSPTMHIQERLSWSAGREEGLLLICANCEVKKEVY